MEIFFDPRKSGNASRIEALRSRKDFFKDLGGAGLLLTMPALLQHCATYSKGRLSGGVTDDPIEYAKAMGFADPILQSIHTGITCPNPHNTQAWKFLIKGPLEMNLYVDPRRILPATDPSTRQIHIGQGAFIEHLSIGARQLGYRTQVRLFPEGTYSVARIGSKPVARIKLIKDPSLSRDPLYAAIPRRATNRAAYAGDFISEAEYRNLLALTGRTHSRFMFLNTPEQMTPYYKNFKEAFEVELLNAEAGRENKIWFRIGDEEIYGKRDGINLPGNAVTGVVRWMAENFIMSRDKFDDPDTMKSSADAMLPRFEKALETTKALVFFKTPGNTMRDWVHSGRDYARFQLAVTKSGMVLQPLSQVLQEYPEIKAQSDAFVRQSGVRPPAKVQMIARVGRSDYHFVTPRRKLSEMLMPGSK